MSKLALKRLTGSDLTLFEWQFGGGDQKSINLNANIFVDQLFPMIVEATRGSRWIPLDLWIFGPGNRAGLNLQRKITKSVASENWLLGGEIIKNPLDDPGRFNPLLPGDYVLFSFEGEIVPSSATALFVAQSLPEDLALHSALAEFGLSGRDTMRALDEDHIAQIIVRARLPEDHPLVSFALTNELQEAALGDAAATERLLRRAWAPNVSIEALRRAREQAGEIGRLGEELVAIHLERQKALGIIGSFEWVSETNAVAPMDFRVTPIAGPAERIDAKTTNGPFDRPLHVSLSELKEMAAESGGPYRIYRVFAADREGARLRISANLKDFAQEILACLAGLPGGITADAVSVDPGRISFDNEIALAAADEDE
ncbi:MAG: hypothetical protein WA459_14270 [Stellaceae bacterium]